MRWAKVYLILNITAYRAFFISSSASLMNMKQCCTGEMERRGRRSSGWDDVLLMVRA